MIADARQGITAVLTAYRRPWLLAEQIAAIRGQSIPPDEVWIWANEPDVAMRDALADANADRIVTSSANAFFHARFGLALTAPTEFVAVFDDDTIPGERWFENCLETMASTPGILGSAGVSLVEPSYQSWSVQGWHRPSDQVAEADLVGHAWFLKTAWISHLFSQPARNPRNGEDIELCARAWRQAGIRTYCPPHPPHDLSLWGSTRGVELGSDGQASSRRAGFLEERSEIVQAEMEAGWKPLYLRRAGGNGHRPKADHAVAPSSCVLSGDGGSQTCPKCGKRRPTRSEAEVPRKPSLSNDLTDAFMNAMPGPCGRVLLYGESLRDLAGRMAEGGATMVVVEPQEALDDSYQVSAREFRVDAARPRLDFLQAGYFDLAIVDQSFASVEETLAFLRTMRELLAPSGRFLLACPNVRHHRVIEELLAGRWRPTATASACAPVRFFTRRELEKVLFRAGFTVDAVTPVECDELRARRAGSHGADVATGQMRTRCDSPEDAEEFFVREYLVTARRELGDAAVVNHSDRVSGGLAALRAAHPWPASRPHFDSGIDGHGWLCEDTKLALREALSDKTRLVIELGSWMGLSTRFIADHAPRAHIIAVDHWKGSPEHHRVAEWRSLLPSLKDSFLAQTWDYRDRVTPLMADTNEGLRKAHRLGLSPDVVYIDAEHSYEAVAQDLALIHEFFPEAGIIGDDFADDGVARAARDYASRHGLTLETVGPNRGAWRIKNSGTETQAEPIGPGRYGLTSIIIVVHDQLAYTRQCLDSIRLVTDEPIEIIVVDNGSTDGTTDYLASIEGLKVIRNSDNRGFPAGANQGVRAAVGEQILLLNNDCIVTTGWLRRLLDALHADASVGLVGPCSNNVSGEQQIPVSYQDLASLDGFAWEHGKRHRGQYRSTDRLVGFCLLVKRAVLDAVGLLDERFGLGNFEDDDFCRRALAAGFWARIAFDAFVHHFGQRTFRGVGTDFAGIMRRNEALYREKWKLDSASHSTPVAAKTADRKPPTPRFSLKAAKGGGLLLERSLCRLTLCMIVRDNARTIEAALVSVRPWVDEMIVVDTGSVDETPAICRRLGAKVHSFPWCDDFSAARNESLGHAAGEWLFWMDSDDTITPENGRKLRDLAAREPSPDVLGFVLQVHCPSGHEERDVTVVDHVKVFRNRPDLRFEHRIHEQILPAIRRAGGEIEFTDIYVTHSGSDQTDDGRKRKLERDFRILRLDLAERPEHPFVLFNLGMTHADAAQYSEAIDYLNRCIVHSKPNESHLRKAYALLVNSYQQSSRHDDAWNKLQEGRQLFPDDPELLFRQGMLHHHFGRHKQAEAAYLRVLEPQSNRHFSSVDAGIFGHKVRHNLARVYEDMGRVDSAQGQWELAVKDDPSYRLGWRALIELLLRERAMDRARLAINRMMEKTSAAVACEKQLSLARLALATGDQEAAIEATAQAMTVLPLDRDAMDLNCRIYFESLQFEMAEASLRNLLRVFPEDSSAHHNLGIVLLQRDRPREAIGEFSRSLSERPEFAPSYYFLGISYEAIGAAKQAVDSWRQGLAVDPENHEILAALDRHRDGVSSFRASEMARPSALQQVLRTNS